MCQLAEGRRRLTRQRRGGSRWDREGSWGERWGGGRAWERENLCLCEQRWVRTGEGASAAHARGCVGERNRSLVPKQRADREERGAKITASSGYHRGIIFNQGKMAHSHFYILFFPSSNHSSNSFPHVAHPVEAAPWQTAPPAHTQVSLPGFLQAETSPGSAASMGRVPRASSACQLPPSVSLQKTGGESAPQKKLTSRRGPCWGQEPTSRQCPKRFFPLLAP